MNERQIHYIQTVARMGSVQKASLTLGKNPSTLTRTIKSCEAKYGISMFERSAQGLKPTPEGSALLEKTGAVLEFFQKLHEMTGEGKDRSWTEQELRYLLAIQEYGNLTRAAEELFIAQPSLSQMVRTLEEDLNEPLFARKPDGMEPTEYGRRILNCLEEIRERYRELDLEMEEFQQMKKGHVTIGIPSNLGTYLLPLVLPAFCERYPGIVVQVREHNSKELEELVLAKKIDLGIMHDDGHRESLCYEYFSDDPFYLVIPAGMKEQLCFPKKRKLTGEDLKRLSGIPFIMVENRQKLRLVVNQILERAGVRPVVRCTSKSMETVKRLAAAGMGVTILPYSYLTLYSGVEGLESYQLEEGLNASWKLAAVCANDRKLSRSAREFLRMLKEKL